MERLCRRRVGERAMSSTLLYFNKRAALYPPLRYPEYGVLYHDIGRALEGALCPWMCFGHNTDEL